MRQLLAFFRRLSDLTAASLLAHVGFGPQILVGSLKAFLARSGWVKAPVIAF